MTDVAVHRDQAGQTGTGVKIVSLFSAMFFLSAGLFATAEVEEGVNLMPLAAITWGVHMSGAKTSLSTISQLSPGMFLRVRANASNWAANGFKGK